MAQHILIAEDSPSQLEILVMLCQQLPDVVVHQAIDGQRAMLQAQRMAELDLVITDINMPGMDGIRLTQELSMLRKLPKLLLLSGHVPELLNGCTRAAAALGYPAIGQLSKPIKPQQFQDEVKRLLTALPPDISDRHTVSVAEILYGLSHNQFLAHYQPVYRQRDWQASQIEALARWQHPDYGLLGPAAFVEKLENDNLILPLTRRIVQTSLDMLTRHDGMRNVRLCINLSGALLNDSDFYDWLIREVDKRYVSPSRISLEITEGIAFSNLGHSLSSLLRMRMKGFELALDDFARGNTNLEHLRDMPITELKLDRSLIKGIAQSGSAQLIMNGVILIAKELKLRVVCEGIDALDDLSYIRQHHPQAELQGFLLCKPVSADQLGKHLLFTPPQTTTAG